MNNKNNATMQSSKTMAHKMPPPVTTQRKIAVDKLKISITSIFAEEGQPTIADKLYIIANRKIKGLAAWVHIVIALFIIAALLALMAQFGS